MNINNQLLIKIVKISKRFLSYFALFTTLAVTVFCFFFLSTEKVDAAHTSGTVIINRIGVNMAPISGTTATITSPLNSFSTTSNPGVFSRIFASFETSYSGRVTDLPGYDEFYNACGWSFPETDCTMTEPYTYMLSSSQNSWYCDGTFCHLGTLGATHQGGMKVSIRYVPESIPTVSDGAVCGEANISWNPSVWNNQPWLLHHNGGGNTSYSIYRANSINGPYSLISPAPFPTTNSFTDRNVNAGEVYYYKVLLENGMGSWKLNGAYTGGYGSALGVINGTSFNPTPYSPYVSSSLQYSPSNCNTGSIKISRYGVNFSVWPSPNLPAGTQGKVDSLPASSLNPSDYINITAGTHTVSATDVPGYTEKFGSCTYPIGGTECSLDATYFSGTGVTCDASFCSVTKTVTAGQVTKVGVVYQDETEYPPETPTNLTAVTSTSCGQGVMLSWTDVTGATQYRIYRSTTLNGVYTDVTVPLAGTTTTSYIDTKNTAADSGYYYSGPSYYYKVLARNMAGDSAQSAAVGPAVPSGLCTGNIKTYIYGTYLDNGGAGVPYFATAGVDSLPASTSNPATWVKLAPGSHTVFAVDAAGYTEKFGSCTYPIGGTECSLVATDLSLSGVTCASQGLAMYGTCSVSKTVTAGQVTKVGVRYEPITPGTTGNIKISRYGSDLAWPSTAPAGTQGKVDSLTASSTNPSDFKNLATGLHTVSASDIAGYTETFGSCTYAIGGVECSLVSADFSATGVTCSGTLCSVTKTVTAGQVTKVGVRYVDDTKLCSNGATNPPTCSCPTGQVEVGGICTPSSTTGSVKIVRYGSDLGWPSTAPSGTVGKVDSLASVSTNPADFSDLDTGSHTAYATDNATHTETFGTCAYDEGDAECNIPESDFNITPVCSAGFCSMSVNVIEGKVIKVGVKYIIGTECTNGATNYPECNNNICTNGATNPPACNNNACTNGANNPPACTTNNGSCLNGATNPPTCNNNACTNGATNPPACNNNTCTNGANNHPACDTCTAPATMVGGLCTLPVPAVITTFRIPNDTVNKNTACVISVNVSNATQCTIIGSNVNAGGSPVDSLNLTLRGGSYNASITTGIISASTRYTLICNGPTGTTPATRVTNCYMNPTQIER